MKIKWTLYKKIQTIIVTILLIIFIVIQMIITNYVRANTQSTFAASVIEISVLLQKNLDIIFSDAEDSLRFIERDFYDTTRNDNRIRDDLVILTDIKGYIKNAFVSFNDGSFILEPNVVIPRDFDPRTRSYYKAAYDSRKINWSEPYTDVATNKLVITSSLYIQFKDIDGVIGVDINLDEIPEILQLAEIGETGILLLANENNQIISASDEKYINQNLDILEDPVFHDSHIISGSLKTKEGNYYLRRLNQGNMRIIAFLPSKDIDRKVFSTSAVSTAILFTSILFAGLLTYYFAKRTMYPIVLLKNTMKASEQSETLKLLDIETNDELNDLIIGYNTLAQNVNAQNKKLKSLSQELFVSEQELQKQFEKAAKLAYKDYLTGLPNRVKFEQTAKIMINDKKTFALFYIDLDNFKYINDTYGHNYGDIVLQIISKRLSDSCNKQYFAARLSGDEFGVLVTEDKSDLIEKIAKQLLELMCDPILYKDFEFAISGSIGISIYPTDGHSFEDLLANADIAMYEAKNKSKNQYLLFSQTLREELINRVTLERQLSQALNYNEIYLCYQPLIDFKTKKVKGFEALARWENDLLGFVPPDVFIPVAEKNLSINAIGYFVLEEAIKFGVEVYEKFGSYYEINVNVSLIQLYLEGFVSEVMLLLEKYNYPAEFLNIEITESVALESSVKIHQKLESLRNAGVNLSLDDFGSGYSSFNHLLSMRLTHLKIDRLIIEEAVKDKTVYQLIQGIVEFAHAVNLKVVAEGIEDLNMESLMAEMTIDYAQGYYYSRPVKSDEAIKYLSQKL